MRKVYNTMLNKKRMIDELKSADIDLDELEIKPDELMRILEEKRFVRINTPEAKKAVFVVDGHFMVDNAYSGSTTNNMNKPKVEDVILGCKSSLVKPHPFSIHKIYRTFNLTGRTVRMLIRGDLAEKRTIGWKGNSLTVRILGEYERFLQIEVLKHVSDCGNSSSPYIATVHKHDIYRGNVLFVEDEIIPQELIANKSLQRRNPQAFFSTI